MCATTDVDNYIFETPSPPLYYEVAIVWAIFSASHSQDMFVKIDLMVGEHGRINDSGAVGKNGNWPHYYSMISGEILNSIPNTFFVGATCPLMQQCDNAKKGFICSFFEKY